MKTILSLLVLVSSSAALAAPVSQKCYKKAAVAVEKAAEEGVYDDGGFETTECSLAPNQKVILCEVAAYKGNGDAVDTYRAVLNPSCTAVYRVDLIGEE